MASLHNPPDRPESSVLFNLRDLMRLEAERVAAEEAAARAALSRAAQARADQERDAREAAEREARAVQAREREAREAENARAVQREASLLRVRAEADARERAEAQRIALEHERALRALQHDAQRSRWTRALGILLALIAVGSGAGYALVVQPALRNAHEHARRAAALQARQARALSDALAQLARERAVPRATPAALPVPSASASAPRSAPSRDAVARVLRAPNWLHKPVKTPEPIGLDGLGEGDDPIEGLPEFDARRRPRNTR